MAPNWLLGGLVIYIVILVFSVWAWFQIIFTKWCRDGFWIIVMEYNVKNSSPTLKLDGVGPVDNRPSTNKLHHLTPPPPKKKDIWHMTHDTVHMICDTWHMTCHMVHMTCCGGWKFSQNFSSLGLTVCDLWYYEDLEEQADRLN